MKMRSRSNCLSQSDSSPNDIAVTFELRKWRSQLMLKECFSASSLLIPMLEKTNKLIYIYQYEQLCKNCHLQPYYQQHCSLSSIPHENSK